MKLVPFILTHKETQQFTMTGLQVFLGHAGKAIWRTEESGSVSLKTILEDYCEPNGFVVKRTYLDKERGIAYLEIDSDKTHLSDFYSWDEAILHPGKPECWRRFLFMKDREQAEWWSPKGLIEAELQDYGNVDELYSSIRSLFPTV